MTFKIKTGYRLNVAMIVLNKDNKVLFCKRRNEENWQFPQAVSYTHLTLPTKA